MVNGAFSLPIMGRENLPRRLPLQRQQRRQEGKGPIPTFTISIQDPTLNEKNEAAVVARHLDA